MLAGESSLTATTSLSSDGPSAKGLGPRLPSGAVRRSLALGEWPTENNARASHESVVRSSV